MVPGAKERPVQEFLNALLFRPLAHLVVLLLLRTPVRPHHLVLFHTGLVLGAAWLLLREDLGAALLLQLKTVLDNADGQLARLRGEVTEFGRYLDTGMDFLGNLALFLALGLRTGFLEKALLAFWFSPWSSPTTSTWKGFTAFPGGFPCPRGLGTRKPLASPLPGALRPPLRPPGPGHRRLGALSPGAVAA